MPGRIKQTDVSEQDVYGLIKSSAEKLELQLKKINVLLSLKALQLLDKREQFYAKKLEKIFKFP